VETLYVSKQACSRTTIRRGVFSFSVAVFGTLGTWGTREESTRERFAELALAAAEVEEEEPLREETGFGGRACRIVEAEEEEAEAEAGVKGVLSAWRRDEMEGPGLVSSAGEVARGEVGRGAMGR